MSTYPLLAGPESASSLVHLPNTTTVLAYLIALYDKLHICPRNTTTVVEHLIA